MIMLLIFLISIIFTISSFSYWSMWLGLELFNFFFIPWLMEESNNYKSSKIFLYFIIQVIASGMFLIGTMNYHSYFFFYMSMISMLIKLGSFPFHFWILMVVENMDWEKFSFFMTISKLGPISIFFFMNPLIQMIKPLWGGLIIPLWGVKTASIRKMLTYSSIAHMSWIITILSLSKSLLWFYLLSYWTIFILSCFFFKSFSMETIKDMLCSSFSFMQIFMILLLMGFPPLLGFFPKLFTLKIMCNNNLLMSSFVMSILSIIPFFFYLKMMMMIFFSFNYKNLSFFSLNSSKKYIFFVFLCLAMSMELFYMCLS